MTADETTGPRGPGDRGGTPSSGDAGDGGGNGAARYPGASAPGAPEEGGRPEEIPLGQKLYDSPFLLLIAGILIMFICFTGWGLWEILSLPPAPLP